MSRRPRSTDNEAFDTVAIPVAAALEGEDTEHVSKVQSVVEWSAKHLSAGAQQRPDEAPAPSEPSDLVVSAARLETDIADHKHLVEERDSGAHRQLGYALGGILIGGLLGGAIVAALHARRR